MNFGYHGARLEGRLTRAAYLAALPFLPSPRITGSVPFEVYSYSGETELAEQVASIRSFLQHAGRPTKFTVVSDGSYSARSIARLRALDRSVSVSEAIRPAEIPDGLRPYLTEHPTGKQLALIMSLPLAAPALYVDSDVLFFPGSAVLAALDLGRNQYLADCRLSADERLFRHESERTNPVNTGVLFLAQKLDWSRSLARFRELEGAPSFFTNQTMTHLAMQANGAVPLDPAKFVLQLDDQFIYPDRYAGREIVLRHYVNPVRHKFWTALWRR